MVLGRRCAVLGRGRIASMVFPGIRDDDFNLFTTQLATRNSQHVFTYYFRVFRDTDGEVLVFLRRIFWKTLYEAVMM